MSFRSLLYTDCRADESLRGGTGYQFQAASTATHPPDEMIMLQDLMYRPSPDLMAREAPEAEYPMSFAYTKTTDGYAIGSGIYLGRVSGDGRQGNQITHALFTDDVADLAATRPAQLFDADLWIREKQPSKSLRTVDAPLIYREEFDLEKLHEMATTTPDAVNFLATVISAFEKAGGDTWVKAIVSCSDPLTAMQWISLGTMLIPTDEALALSIRAFVTDPVSAAQRIIGVHPPSMNRPPEVTTLQAVNGIDLDTHTTSKIDVTQRAAYWADKFINGDPYEVIDAIELAGRLRATEPTNRTVAGAVMLGEPLTTAEAVAAVAEAFASFDADEFDEFAEPLVDALELAEQDSALTPDALLRVIRVVVRFGGPASPLRDRLQENLLVRAAATPEFAARLVDEATDAWTWHQPPSADSQTGRSLSAAMSQLEDTALPGAFEFALLTAVPVDPNEARDAAHRLARHWVHHPELTGRQRGWIHGDRVLDLMVQALEHEVVAGQPPSVEAAMEAGQWDWLLGIDWVLRGGGPLGAEIASRSIPKADPRRQEQLIRDIAGATGPGGWVPMWRNRAPDLAEVMFWLDARPMDVGDPRFAAAIGPAVARAIDAGRIRGRVLRIIDDIYRAAPDQLPQSVTRIARQNLELSRMLRALNDRRDHAGLGRALAATDPIILNIRLAETVGTLVDNAAEFEDIAEFLERAKVDAGEQLMDALDKLAASYPVAALQTAYALTRISKLPKAMLKQINAFPLRWYERASDEVRESVGDQLHRKWPEWDETEAQFERKHESTVKKVGRRFNREKGR